MTPGGGAPRDGEDGFLAARERARQRAASGQIGAGQRALPLSRLASTHYADEDEDGGFLAGRKSERTRLTPAGALASDSSYDPAPPPRGGSASHRVSSQRMVEIEMNEGPSADTPSSASTDSGEYEGEHTTCCGCSSGLFVFWRFALALSVLLSLADTASDISVIVLLARDENWTGFGMTLGFTVVPNFVIGFYEAKELKAHGESQLVQLVGLLCSFLGVGVAFTAVRAISKKEAHSGIGEQGFPVAHFRAVRLLEVMFESVPQAILQTYFAIQSDKLSFFGTLTFGEVLFRLSIMFSLIQVAFFLTSMECTGSSAFDGFGLMKLCTAATLLFLWRVGEVGSRVFLLSMFAYGFAPYAAILEVVGEAVVLFLLVGAQQVLRWALRKGSRRQRASRDLEMVVGLPSGVSGHETWAEAKKAAAAHAAAERHLTPSGSGLTTVSTAASDDTTIVHRDQPHDESFAAADRHTRAADVDRWEHASRPREESTSASEGVATAAVPRHRRTATPETLTQAMTTPVLDTISEVKAFGQGDYGLMAMGLPVFFVSDARGYNDQGVRTGLYEARAGQGLSNLSRGIIPAALYFTVRAISQVVMGMLVVCGSGSCSLTDLAGDLEGWNDGTTRVAILCAIIFTGLMWFGLGVYRWVVVDRRRDVLRQRGNWRSVAEIDDHLSPPRPPVAVAGASNGTGQNVRGAVIELEPFPEQPHLRGRAASDVDF